MSKPPLGDTSAMRPYDVEHIATDPRHIKREDRYAVVRVSDGERVSTHVWSGAARDAADALAVAEGACSECYGEGSVIVDYLAGGDGEIAIGGTCPRCDGTGREP